jgi:hypothetical protein
MLVVSIVGRPVRREGHLFSYHEAVGKACAEAGMPHHVFAGRSADNADPWPPSWHRASLLDEGSHPGKSAVLHWRRDAALWQRLFNDYLPSTKEPTALLLLDSCDGRQMPPIAMAAHSCRIAPSITAMPILRMGGSLSTPYRLMTGNPLIFWASVRFLQATDSESIANALRKKHGVEVQLLPIPHVPPYFPQQCHQAGINPPKLPFRVWFPGDPRDEKGLSVVLRFAEELRNTELGCTLAVDRRALKGIPSSDRITAIEGPLGPADYDRAMQQSDCVLLPYDAERYREATSGIFIEAVCAGKLPFVTKGTWMASKLVRCGLEDLTFSWTEPNVFSRFRTLYQAPHIRSKFDSLSRATRESQGPGAFASVLKDIESRIDATP